MSIEGLFQEILEDRNPCPMSGLFSTVIFEVETFDLLCGLPGAEKVETWNRGEREVLVPYGDQEFLFTYQGTYQG